MTNRFTDKFKIWGLNGCFGVKMWQGLSKNDVIRAYLITILTKSSLNDPADFFKRHDGPLPSKKASNEHFAVCTQVVGTMQN